jgi:hypothetical protein
MCTQEIFELCMCVQSSVTPSPEHTYISLKQHHSYEQMRDTHKLQCRYGNLNMNSSTFNREIKPAFGLLAAACKYYQPGIIRYDDRKEGLLGSWNHVAFFDDVFTMIWDGAPFEAFGPTSWFRDDGIGASELQSGKYNTTVYKMHLGCGFHGCIHGASGLHLGF